MAEPEGVVLTLPFRGPWQTRNSRARRVPSHGTDLFATTYALDFVAVRERRTAGTRDWRTVIGAEPNERFHAFGQPILAPGDATVVTVHDGEPDHTARRSPLTLVPYLMTQASRVRGGAGAVAGNHIVLALSESRGYVLLAHLRRGTTRVGLGDAVRIGDPLGECGNSGNSTQPHLHIQAMDSDDPYAARGVPVTFRSYRAWSRSGRTAQEINQGVPGEAEIVEAL